MTQSKALHTLESVFSQQAIKVLFGALILFAGAQIAIPLKPVPIVLSTVSVMLIGLLYDRKSALSSVAIYLTAGGLGLPVFQGFVGGLAAFKGATAGYLLGFFLAVLVMTSFRKKFGADTFVLNMINCLLGTSMIFLAGISWLSLSLGIKVALSVGLYPFIIPGIAKTFILCGALKIIKGNKLAQ